MHRSIASVAILIVALLSASCAAVGPSASPVSSSTVGAYTLGLRLDRLHWDVGEPMTGTASLSYGGAAPRILYGSGGGLIGFTYVEVGGKKRQVGGAWTADCAPHPIAPGVAMATGLTKGAGYDPNNPADDWIIGFINANGVQLPAGTWDVTAQAMFVEDACGGAGYDITATVRVTVGG